MSSLVSEIQSNLINPLNVYNIERFFPVECDNKRFFCSDFLNKLNNHYFFLKSYAYSIPLEVKFHRRPDYFSYHIYKTVLLTYLIMYLNNIYSFEDFVLDYVNIVDMNVVQDFIKEYLLNKNDKFILFSNSNNKNTVRSSKIQGSFYIKHLKE